MPYEVFAIVPGVSGGRGLSEEVAAAVGSTYERVAAFGGEVIASHTLAVNDTPRGGETLFLVAQYPDGAERPHVTKIDVQPPSCTYEREE